MCFISAIQVFTRMSSRSPSPDLMDQSDTVNSNIQNVRYSDDDNLETIGRKVSEIISATNGNIFSDNRNSDNGNVSDDADGVLKKRRCSETRDALDSGEDCANDSFTDEEGEVVQCDQSLRRRRYLFLIIFCAIGIFFH